MEAGAHVLAVDEPVQESGRKEIACRSGVDDRATEARSKREFAVVAEVLLCLSTALAHFDNGYVSELNHLEGKEEGYSFLNEPGFQLLNGRQALGYSRIRAIGTDFARTGRQRTVLEALMRQIKAQPHKIVEAINRVLPDLTTNIDDNRMFLYGLETISLMLLNHISQFQVPAEHYWENAYMPNGQEVLAIDFEHNNIDLRRAIYE